MKKQIALILVSFIFLFNTTIKAQDETAFEKGTVVATVGYGFPDLYRTSLRVAYNANSSKTVSGFGPFIIKGDYGIVKFKWGHTVGAGIALGYSSTTVNDKFIQNQTGSTINYVIENDITRTITIGARGTYHFFTKEKIDCYASIGAGFNINISSLSSNGVATYYGSSSPSSRSVVYESATVGIRYYFTKNFGVYSELGWDMWAPIQAGVALKF